MKKLAAIYNVWDGVELLPGSIKCIYDHVDMIIIVYQNVSNFGEAYKPFIHLMEIMGKDIYAEDEKILFVKYDPIVDMGGSMNERAKRNLGLYLAKMNHVTHFLHMDCDEYYEDFGAAKNLYFQSGKQGSVVSLDTYFRRPTLKLESREQYYVPFIHELNEDTNSGSSSYPFYTDPTRAINTSDVVELPVFMQHFSWVRMDIERKARNSSARDNIKNGTMLKDYYSTEVGPGFYVTDYASKLVEVPNTFDIKHFCY